MPLTLLRRSLGCAAMLLLTWVPALHSQLAERPATVATCVAGERTDWPLTLDDSQRVYIEPNAFVASGRQVLLAGWPNYVMVRRNGEWHLRAPDSIFAVILDETGAVRPLAPPIAAARIRWPRAEAMGGGRWAVVFAEYPEGTRINSTSPPERHWFGITDGVRWVQLDTLPTVFVDRWAERMTAPLVLDEDVLIATPVRNGIAIYRGSGGTWAVDTVRTTSTPGYVTLGRGIGGEVLLGVVMTELGPTRPRDSNSFFLYRLEGSGSWSRIARLIDGLEQKVHDPQLSRDGTGRLTWTSGMGGGPGFSGIADTAAYAKSQVTIDTAVYHAVHIASISAAPLWAIVAIRGAHRPVRELELKQLTDTLRTLDSFPSPFEGPMAALMRDTTILITGPIFRPEPVPTLYSAVIGIPLRCTR